MSGARGFSLIETLVALVVLSIGLLGIAALHVDSVRNGQSALQRTRAVTLAADMADRIRANPLGDYDVGSGMAAPLPQKVCADGPNGEASGPCTVEEMTAYDIWDWRTSLQGVRATGLPDGQGGIELDATTDPDSLVITINWTDKGQPNSYRLTVQ